jgi:hypothetical protein
MNVRVPTKAGQILSARRYGRWISARPVRCRSTAAASSTAFPTAATPRVPPRVEDTSPCIRRHP